MSVRDSVYRSCQRHVVDAVEAAIDAGASAAEFKQMVRECWDATMRQKIKDDDKELAS